MLVSSILILTSQLPREQEEFEILAFRQPEVSHLQHQGKLGSQSWLRVSSFDSVTKNTWEIIRKLVGGCQGVPCLPGFYLTGMTTCSLGFHSTEPRRSHWMGCGLWLCWSVWSETKNINISQPVLLEETWKGGSQWYWVLILLFTARSCTELRARWADRASLTHSWLLPKRTVLPSQRHSHLVLPLCLCPHLTWHLSEPLSDC